MNRLWILTGHYGSGKSEVAVNLAIDEQLDYLVDLDVVNPYFRSRSVHALLEANGVSLVESTIEKATGSDLPFISAKGSRPFHDKASRAVYDLAGTQAGAKLMRQYTDIIDEREIEFWLVVNIYRMETANEAQILNLINTLEGASGLKVTGLINNSNLMHETTEEHIKKGDTVLNAVSKKTGLPIVFTFIEEEVKTNLKFAGENRRLIRHLGKHWL